MSCGPDGTNDPDSRRLARCLLVVGVAVALLATVGSLPASAQQTDPGNYTLEDLRSDGLQRSDSPASVRASGQGDMFWMVYWPSDRPWATPGEDTNWKYLSSSTTVLRNAVYLRGINNQDESQRRTLNVVYWRSVPEENATGSTVQIAATESKQVRMGSGWFSQRIRLQKFEQPVEERVVRPIGDHRIRAFVVPVVVIPDRLAEVLNLPFYRIRVEIVDRVEGARRIPNVGVVVGYVHCRAFGSGIEKPTVIG